MSNIFPNRPTRHFPSNTKIGRISERSRFTQAIRLGSPPASLFCYPVIGTQRPCLFLLLHGQKEKSRPTLSLNKGSLAHIKISHNFEDKKSTQNVSTYSKRSKRGEEQFYKPATHLNVPQRGSASADPCG